MPKFQFWLPTNLTRVQQRAVDSIEPIFLSGVPGTGKTVVSIKRLQNSSSSKKKSIIFFVEVGSIAYCLHKNFGL